MAPEQHYRILSPDGSLSRDTFVVAPDQPEKIIADCLLVTNEMTGRRVTVHGTRLFPAELDGSPAVTDESRSRCLQCGHVSGVVDDEVVCPVHGDEAACVFVRAQAG